MTKFTVVQYLPNNEYKHLELESFELPRIGDVIDHDPSGIYGTVFRVLFHWDEEGVLEIEVRLRG